MMLPKGLGCGGDERGSASVTAIFYMLCLCGAVSILLLLEQAHFLSMRMQQTADLITKGARAAGTWEYEDEAGNTVKRLFATSKEAEAYGADIVRGAREEAEILYQLNEPGLLKTADFVDAVHQKGEKKSLYRQGIYHLQLEAEGSIWLFGGEEPIAMRRVSQSGLY